MLRFEQGNIVTGNYPVFCHQVNCKGVMGAGLAKQIRNKYPKVYTEYKEICDNNKAFPGLCHLTRTSDGRVCIDMFAQDGYGKDKCYTDYKAFKACLRGLEVCVSEFDSIAFPYGIGCGLAGGDWYIILGILEDFAKRIKQDVIIVSSR